MALSVTLAYFRRVCQSDTLSYVQKFRLWITNTGTFSNHLKEIEQMNEKDQKKKRTVTLYYDSLRIKMELTSEQMEKYDMKSVAEAEGKMTYLLWMIILTYQMHLFELNSENFYDEDNVYMKAVIEKMRKEFEEQQGNDESRWNSWRTARDSAIYLGMFQFMDNVIFILIGFFFICILVLFFFSNFFFFFFFFLNSNIIH